ncbi:MAG TPA: beta-ketoacyl-[acyl-carrier-protein] synthase family protein [Pseudolabrys sp.]|nr:beta-ketoacyl-[acyl-carrier-protein] synthase family protein [Pseudolabrys sp.]
MNRVAITGLGVVSPAGQSVRDYWDCLIAGRPALTPSQLGMAAQTAGRLVGEVKGFDPAAHFEPAQVLLLDRVSQFAVVAARQAVSQSGLTLGGALAERTAAIIGTGSGGHGTVDESFRRLYAQGAARLHPLTIPKAMISAPASQVSIFCGTKGPAFAVSSACASASHAIGQAFHMVRGGTVTCAVAGGAEASLTFGAMKGWEAMRIMSPDTCRPFSRERKGMVIGEGAAVVVLEALDHARGRGADILAEIVGFGMSADSQDLTAPDANGMARAIGAALADAASPADAIDYVNAHGTGTTANDAAETAALHLSFGAHARQLAVSSTKSAIGHALGAAGALELVAAIMAIRDGIAPPTMNYLGTDADCDLDYVPNEARRMPVRTILSNSFAFGGLNAVLAARRYTG